jgi:hypothetical protein
VIDEKGSRGSQRELRTHSSCVEGGVKQETEGGGFNG